MQLCGDEYARYVYSKCWGIGEIEVCTKSATPFFKVGALISR